MLLHPKEDNFIKFDETILQKKTEDIVRENKIYDIFSFDNLAFYEFVSIQDQITIGKELAENLKLKEKSIRKWISKNKADLNKEEDMKAGYLLFLNEFTTKYLKDNPEINSNLFRFKDDIFSNYDTKIKNIYRKHNPHLIAWFRHNPLYSFLPFSEWEKGEIIETLEHNNSVIMLLESQKRNPVRINLMNKSIKQDLQFLFYFNSSIHENYPIYEGDLSEVNLDSMYRELFLLQASYRAKHHYLLNRRLYKTANETLFIDKLITDIGVPAALELNPSKKDDPFTIMHAIHITWEYMLRLQLFNNTE